MVAPGDPWPVLGIAPTADVRAIKKAYAARLKHANPEDDPEAFQRLRQAYEAAIAFAEWQRAHKDAPRPRRPPGAPEPRRDPLEPRAPLQAVDPAQPPDPAAALLVRAEQLCQDPERRASQGAWQALLASEALWNVDVRARFERGLIALLLRRGSAFAPAVGCLLEQEFHWTRQALSLHRTFPGHDVDGLIERLEQAPLEHARELCEEGRYAEARALLRPVAEAPTGDRARVAAARRLLARCVDGETADRLIQEVERLRVDERAWASVDAWRRLLDHKDLRSADVRAAFQLRLAKFLAARGEGLPGSVWRLLYRRYDWPASLPKAVLARALPLVGTAIAEDVELLLAQGRQHEIVGQWAEVILGLEGDAALRSRAVLERCILEALARAQTLADQAEHADAIEEIARVAAVATGETGSKARALLERSSGAILDLAQEHLDRKRYRAAIAQLGPVVRHLDGAIGTQARLLLARGYFGDQAFGKAEHYLKEVLRAEPRNVAVLLELGAVCRARGLTERAWETYRRVLALEPGHPEAQAQVALLERQLQEERVARERERERAQAAPRPAASSASPDTGAKWWPLALVFALNGLRSCAPNGVSAEQLGAVVAITVVALVLGFGLQQWRQARSAVTGLMAAPATEPRLWPRILIGALAGLAATASIVFLLRSGPEPFPPAPSKAGKVDAHTLSRGDAALKSGNAALDSGKAAQALPLLKTAVELNPRARDVFESQGRALNELGRADEAMAAFTRQIQIDPRHPRAYAWRAKLHMDAARWDDAERELLKQIEVAPSVPWSYEQLARRRMMQRRYPDAIELFAACTKLEPAQAGRWLDLGRAQAFASRSADARASIDKAMTLAPDDSVRIEASAVYRRLGFAEKAGEAARSALPSLEQRLSALRPDSFGRDDLYLTGRLTEAWRAIGIAALAKGDLDEAGRYLEAAWRSSLSSMAAVALADLRQRQRRVRDAEELRRAAQNLVEGGSEQALNLLSADAAGLRRLFKVHPTGPALGGLEASVFVLVDAGGRVEGIRQSLGDDAGELERQRQALAPIRLPPPGPDRKPIKLVRRAQLRCSPVSGCDLLLQAMWEPPPAKARAQVRIAQLDASEALPLRPGSRIWLTATVAYSGGASAGELKLLVRDQPGLSLREIHQAKLAAASGTITLKGAYQVPAQATALDVEVQLLSAESRGTLGAATAWLAVAER